LILADATARLTAMFFLLLPCILIPLPALGAPSSLEEFSDFRPSGIMALGILYFGLFGLLSYRLEAAVERQHREEAVTRMAESQTSSSQGRDENAR
jgi:hypothetical protein